MFRHSSALKMKSVIIIIVIMLDRYIVFVHFFGMIWEENTVICLCDKGHTKLHCGAFKANESSRQRML